MYQMWVRQSCHTSCGHALQCDRVETPVGAGDDAVTDVCQQGDWATVLRNP